MNVRLKQLRKALNFTQQEFADRLKIKEIPLQRMKREKVIPVMLRYLLSVGNLM